MEDTEDSKTTGNVFQKRKKSCFSKEAPATKQKGRYKEETSNMIKVMAV